MDTKNDIPQIPLSELFTLINLEVEKVVADYDSGRNLYHRFEINPEDFVRFAEEDIKSGDLRGLVNSLSNSKRAIDSQINKVLICFGISTNKNFPKKMEILQSMGIVSPRIIRKVSNARNYLEHDFKKPNPELVEDALDIATLFIHSINGISNNFLTDYKIGMLLEGKTTDRYNFERAVSVHYNDEDKYFNLTAVNGEINLDKSYPLPWVYRAVAVSSVRSNDPHFLELVKLTMLVKQDFETEIDYADEIRKTLCAIMANSN